MSSDYFIQQLTNALSLGSIYALTAIGYTIVYGILRLINFAHGDILMLGAYFAGIIFVQLAMPFPAAIILSMMLAALIGVTIERAAYRPLRRATEETTLITSFAVSILMQNLAMMIFSPQPKKFEIPGFLQTVHTMGNVSFTNMKVLIILLSVVLMVALTIFIKRTKMGIAMRASAENIDASTMMGIDVNAVVRVAFIIGSSLAAVAGLMLGGQYGQVSPLMGFVPGLKAFVAAVIGGIGNIPGAALGGYLLGIGEVLFVGLLPSQFSEFRDAFVFIVLILVLLVRPTGILGIEEDRRV
ncbi:branched-chain amino acid transport system permease protein [Desulfotomaculum arcticum]|uniref:Branched-chain amino acid transport system permease protein n=1 Tax=Desulfotruncus arcticus DSM 17038 TaxID=1121424 RepID=A0A1I2V964_9FIRM|nr:branched-chain amino acid ABC transporter permease [Desulfotruncus arcticus]SFG84737.1 branched-chain amino acid transport system permease protein [Desulfotomaculum arcticum] [Desulfotruncus arcticus DSM 17038]